MSDPFKTRTGVITDPSEVVPHVGMTGKFALKAPFSTLLNPSVEYTCISVMSISGAVASGQDPLQDVYLSQKATESDFAADEAANRCLVMLQSGAGTVITVPASAMLTLPDADGVLYSGVMMGISLSAVPNDLDLTALQGDVSELVFSRIGVRSSVYLATTTAPSVLSHSLHATIEAARQANIVSNLSLYMQNEQLKTGNTALVEKVRVLENYISRSLPPAA